MRNITQQFVQTSAAAYVSRRPPSQRSSKISCLRSASGEPLTLAAPLARDGVSPSGARANRCHRSMPKCGSRAG